MRSEFLLKRGFRITNEDQYINVGRYFNATRTGKPVGPQSRYYLPEPWLRTDAPKPPLTDAIRSLTVDPSLTIEFNVTGQPRNVSAASEHALFRAAQEGLTNVRKHARAHRATLALDFSDPTRIRLHLQDDGQGAAATASVDGFGLRGMRERVGLLGGLVAAGPRPEGGFALTVEVPA